MRFDCLCWRWALILALLIHTYGFTTGPDAIYLHIPFCRRRCYYCSFPIKVIGDKENTRIAETDAYTNLLVSEIKQVFSDCISKGYVPSKGIDTVYFGGGTPSLLSNHNVRDILVCINDFIPLSQSAEITMEMDPGTFDSARLNQLKEIGINRVSMGVQSFDEELLRLAGRAHNLKDVYVALEAIHASTIGNFNIDLISSLPTSTLDKWQHTLSEGVKSGCSHLSVYDLQIEEHTAFGKWYSPGVFPMPSEDNSALMYANAVQALTSSGFEHYEISNYARPGRRSRHNQKYWSQQPFFGVGMGATSFLHNRRESRPKSLPEYKAYVEKVTSGCDTIPVSLLASSTLTSRDAMLDHIMLALRTAEGVNVTRFKECFGEEATGKLVTVLLKYVDSGLVKQLKSDEGDWTVRLTDPQGFMVSNDIISSVFAAL